MNGWYDLKKCFPKNKLLIYIIVTSTNRASAIVNTLLASSGLSGGGGEGVNYEPQASDIARDVNGEPLDLVSLSMAVGARVVSYRSPESESVRYLMSEAVRLYLDLAPTNNSEGGEDDACDVSTLSTTTTSVFYKRAVMRELPHVQLKADTAPLKLARDVRSYQVECGFLASKACTSLLDNANIYLPHPLRSELVVVEGSPMDTRFSTMLEDFSPNKGWMQKGILTEKEEVVCCVRSVARWHAFFWNGRVGKEHDPGSEVAEELDKAVWDSGCYWSPQKQGRSLTGKIAAKWEEHRFAVVFGDAVLNGEGAITDPEELRTLGERLQNGAMERADAVHLSDGFQGVEGADPNNLLQSTRSRDHPQRTLIHGDLKAANMFFRKNTADGGVKAGKKTKEGEGELECALIDFQWAGHGLGAVDLAYFIAASVAPELLQGDGEKSIIEAYYVALQKALVEFGAAASKEAAETMITRSTLLMQYETALLDLFRIVVSYHWPRIKACPEVLKKKAGGMGVNGYNKNVQQARWLILTCNRLLKNKL